MAYEIIPFGRAHTHSLEGKAYGSFESYYIKIQIFWEGHKNLAHLPIIIRPYEVMSNKKLKLGQLLVASEGISELFVVEDSGQIWGFR